MSSIKIIIASQATHINLYKNLKSKISKCCASIYFNKQCLTHSFIIKYILDVVLDGCTIYELLLNMLKVQQT